MNTPAVSFYLAKLPLEFIRWWFLEAPFTLTKILLWVFNAFIHLFSFKSLFTTFFKPWKNEYREGLVRTAIFIGAFMKSLLIVFDLFMFGVIACIEGIILITWVSLPFLVLFSIYGVFFA